MGGIAFYKSELAPVRFTVLSGTFCKGIARERGPQRRRTGRVLAASDGKRPMTTPTELKLRNKSRVLEIQGYGGANATAEV